MMNSKGPKGFHNDKSNTWLLYLMMVLGDYFVIILAEEAALFTRYQSFVSKEAMFLGQTAYWFAVPAIFIMFSHSQQLYSQRVKFWQVVKKCFYSCNYAMLSVILLMYALKVSAESSRLFVGFLWFYSFCFISSFRYFLKKLSESLSLFKLPVLIAGSGALMEDIIQRIKNNADMGYKIVGVFTDNESAAKLAPETEVLGELEDMEAVLKVTCITTVIVAIEGGSQEWVHDYICRVQLLVKNVIFVPGPGALPPGQLQAQAVFDDKLTLLVVKNNLASLTNIIQKLVFDYILAIICLVVLSPVFVLLTWKLRQDSPGPVIYDGMRIGRNGKLFKCYKFRSMYIDSEAILEQYLQEHEDKRLEWNTYHKLVKDPRITPLGRFLRETSLDELPQLINVLRGEMSLVGPRPYLPSERDAMGSSYDTIVLAKPGITGYWQVNGRSEVDFKTRLNMDSWYIYNWQIWMDIAILWKTGWVVLHRKGAK